MNKTTKNNIKYLIVLIGVTIGVTAGFIIGLATIASFVVFAPQPTQYMAANLFPLYVFYPNGNIYKLYPQLQPNGTACIQYIVFVNSTPFNYITQNNSVITTIIYNATQVKDIYLNLAGVPIESKSGIIIQIQPDKSLLCPDIEKGR
ncbi:MAG: hypothetical protein QXN16_02975 [Candidatus Micrarchaeaceae archaeon]